MQSALFNTYNRAELTFSHGKGAWIWDLEGHRYLDTSSGLGVNILGHNHPTLVKTIQDQVEKLIHVSNGFNISSQEALGKNLAKLTGLDKAFICNCGSEANETALKLARLYAKEKGIKQPSVIVMENAFHGRTLATLSASSSRKIQAGFEPLVQGFVRAPFNDFEAVEQIANQRDDVVAVMLEPIQGYGGVVEADPTYITQLRQLCDDKGWLLIADEIQTGMGRTGQFLCLQHYGVVPDVVTLAKGLGGGVPIGACVTKAKYADLFTPGSHGSTFGGNPLATTAANTVLNLLENGKLIEQAKNLGDLLMSSLNESIGQLDCVKAIRGKGLMIGIELIQDAMPVKAQARLHGLLIDVTAGKVIRLLPSYVMQTSDIDTICQKLSKALGANQPVT